MPKLSRKALRKLLARKKKRLAELNRQIADAERQVAAIEAEQRVLRELRHWLN